MKQASFDEKMAHVEWLAEQARWAAMTLPKRGTCTVDDKTAVMDKEYFDALGDYSMSLPTGTYVGKRWKRDMNGNAPHWRCDTCGAVFTGWAREGDTCPKRVPGRTSECEGKVHHFEMAEKWYMGEYYELEGRTDEVGIRWREIVMI